MDLFEFIMILVSIVVGLGMSSLLVGFADLVKARRERPIYWLQVGQGLLVLIFLMLIWWRTYNLRVAAEEVWTFGLVSLLVLSLTFLFFSGHLVFPKEGDDPIVHYDGQRALVYVSLALSFIVIAPVIAVVFGNPLMQQILEDVLWAVPLLALAFLRWRPLHWTLVPLMVAAILYFTVNQGVWA